MPTHFETTMTEADFKQPLLDATEERLLRDTHGDVDLKVEGLKDSFFSWFVGLFSGGRRESA